MAKKSDDRVAATIIAKAQAKEDRAYAARISHIKRAIAGADFLNFELDCIEPIVFAAYGRTKLRLSH